MGRSVVGGSVAGYRSVAGYVGPGNLVPGATAWRGLRAYSDAVIGNNAVRLRRDSDNAEQDFVTVAGGGLDLPSITTFKGAANLLLVKLYDQTGNGNDLTQATAARQQVFALASLGSLPTITCDGVSLHTLDNLAVPSIAAPTTLSWVAKNTAGSGAAAPIWSSQGSAFQAQYNNSGANQVLIYAGSVLSAVASDNSWHALQGVLNGVTSDMNVDGTANTGTTGAATGDTTEILFGISGGNVFAGSFAELGRWSIAFSGAQSSAMSANQHTYWGF